MVANFFNSVHLLDPVREFTPTLMFWLARIDPKEVDVLAQVQESWQHFVKTGQIWALLIGLFLGYLFKSFTSY
jgi:hypothetical protein